MTKLAKADHSSWLAKCSCLFLKYISYVGVQLSVILVSNFLNMLSLLASNKDKHVLGWIPGNTNAHKIKPYKPDFNRWFYQTFYAVWKTTAKINLCLLIAAYENRGLLEFKGWPVIASSLWKKCQVALKRKNYYKSCCIFEEDLNGNLAKFYLHCLAFYRLRLFVSSVSSVEVISSPFCLSMSLAPCFWLCWPLNWLLFSFIPQFLLSFCLLLNWLFKLLWVRKCFIFLTNILYRLWLMPLTISVFVCGRKRGISKGKNAKYNNLY